MNTNQKRLLSDLAKQIKTEPKNRARIVGSLKSAKIITKTEKLSNHYSNLEKALSAAK